MIHRTKRPAQRFVITLKAFSERIAENMSEKNSVQPQEILTKLIRIITVAPFMALLLTTLLYLNDPSMFGGISQYLASIFFLTVMPVLAYPLQPFILGFITKKRDGQRRLAFITAFLGYICGIIFAVVTKAPLTMHVIYWTYFLSVSLLTLFNGFTPWKASGHACGVCGPIVVMVYYLGPVALVSILLYIAMFWASVKMNRHTPLELILGGLDSVAAFAIVIFVIHIILRIG